MNNWKVKDFVEKMCEGDENTVKYINGKLPNDSSEEVLTCTFLPLFWICFMGECDYPDTIERCDCALERLGYNNDTSNLPRNVRLARANEIMLIGYGFDTCFDVCKSISSNLLGSDHFSGLKSEKILNVVKEMTALMDRCDENDPDNIRETAKTKLNELFKESEIHNYIMKIFEKMKREYGEKFKGFNFRKKEVLFFGNPDYKLKSTQWLYSLLFTYAYAYEYKKMYEDLFDSYELPEDITVTSFGCGNMVDYWSLIQVMEERGFGGRIVYKGVDEINWQDNFLEHERSKDEVHVFNENIYDYLKSKKILGSDIYVFPKSIGEFQGSCYNDLMESFLRKEIKKDKFYVLCSMPKDRPSSKERLYELIDRVERNGYKLEKYQVNQEIDKQRIREHDFSFDYPDEVNSLFWEKKKLDEEVEPPTTRTKYVEYRILSFIRREKS